MLLNATQTTAPDIEDTKFGGYNQPVNTGGLPTVVATLMLRVGLGTLDLSPGQTS
jgi:hypothetical protein